MYERARPQAAGTGASARTSPEATALVGKLQSRDAHVRAHEAAYMAAGGAYVHGGASYSYEEGPDGKQYAVGGEVGIDMSPVPNDPRATIKKMETVRAAALAPSDPSAADLSVAGAATQIEAQAWSAIAGQQRAASTGAGSAHATSSYPKGSLVNAVA